MAEYFLGLDIGTDSVGWAVTNTEYQIIKKHGQALWGVRLFPEAEKAEERRKFRTARRRLERRKQRIEWLRELFSPEIAKVDPAFFLRVDESKYLEADKQLTENGQPLGRYTLFADAPIVNSLYEVYKLHIIAEEIDQHGFCILKIISERKTLIGISRNFCIKQRGRFYRGTCKKIGNRAKLNILFGKRGYFTKGGLLFRSSDIAVCQSNFE